MRTTVVNLPQLREHLRIAPLTASEALDGAQRTLHIRCGHDIMEKLAVAGFGGDFLWFGDPYVEGPVPRAATLEEFVRTRAKHLEDQGYTGNAFHELYESYRSLARARDYALVNIWMEHDSFDQLVLAKLLDYFSEPSNRPVRLRLISITDFPGVARFIGLGQLPPEALRTLWSEFADVTEAQFELGRAAWSALTSPTPEAAVDLVNSATPALPTMARAFARHVRELPSTRNGSSLTEQLTLQILAEKGPMNAPRLFGWYTNHYEPLPFLGDASYWTVLRRLASGVEPAIAIEDQDGAPRDNNKNWHVRLLPFGERVLRDEADWVRTSAIERWVGGVHIGRRDAPVWRFDEASGKVVQC